MGSGSQGHGWSLQQEILLAKPLTSLGLSLLIFKMEGEEFVKVAIKGCLEFPIIPLPAALGREVLRVWEQGCQHWHGEEAPWAEEHFQRRCSSFPRGCAWLRLEGTEATAAAPSALQTRTPRPRATR